MSISLNQKLALERCHLYMSQLCAITHFLGEMPEVDRNHTVGHIHDLIKQTVKELKFVEAHGE